MAFFPWDKSYEFGIPIIDKDHQVLVDLIDNLYDAMVDGDANNQVHSIVSKLIDYAKLHFKREEFYMESIEYKELLKHTSEHQAFQTRVNGFVEKLDAGINNISVEVVSFLRDWLINHIQHTDKKLVKELLSNKTFSFDT